VEYREREKTQAKNFIKDLEKKQDEIKDLK
jgi:hypothetical protein